jgi:hypothetical protein
MVYDDGIINRVWEQGSAVRGCSPDNWRMDIFGALIGRTAFDKQGSPYGWEIAKLDPEGPDEAGNLRPLHWQSARARRAAAGRAPAKGPLIIA